MRLTWNFKTAIVWIVAVALILVGCFIYIFQEVQIQEKEKLVLSQKALIENYATLQKNKNNNNAQVTADLDAHRLIKDSLGKMLMDIVAQSPKTQVVVNGPVSSKIVELKKTDGNYYAVLSNGSLLYGQDSVITQLEDKQCSYESLVKDLCGTYVDVMDFGYLRHQSTTTAMIGDFTSINILLPNTDERKKISLEQFLGGFNFKAAYFSVKIQNNKITQLDQVSF